MSSGVPRRRSAIESSSARWPASPIACHWASEAGFERTKPGRDAVHANAVGAQLARGLAREADEAGLGARVGLDAGEAVRAPGAGRDVHDGAAAPALHDGRDRAGEVKRAVEVDGEDHAPVVVGDVLDRPHRLAGHAAGGVHEHVDAPGRLERARHEGTSPRAGRARPPRPSRTTRRATASTAARVASSSAARTSHAHTRAP